MRRNDRVPAALHAALDAAWSTRPGFARLSAVNHTVMGRRFIVTAFGFFCLGGLLAMLMRAQLATPRSSFLGPEIYNQIFTMHGTVMMFLFAIPMIEGAAMYLLPKMLGARDLAFPRLSAYGYWCYLFGGTILIVALVAGVAPDAGWFMYTPLSSSTYSPGINADVWLIGVTFVEISAVCAATEILVSILKVRAPGMSLDRLPIFAWYMLVTAAMMLVGFPPLILGSILLEVERAFGWPFFDPTRGGDPLLWQHLFWIFGHPEVYIIFLPAAGLVSTILPVLAGRPLVGYGWIVVSVIALAFLSFGLWVHHMFTVGIPHLALAFFSAASLMVVVPTSVQMFSWIATLASGRPRLKLPMLFLLGFFFIFVAGGLTGVMVAIVPFDWQVHDTHFVVAHFHYVLVGGMVFPMLAAAYYYLPHFTGRGAVYRLGNAVFWLVFIGFNLTFLIMHLTGLLGMPRRVYGYSAELGWEWPNLISSIGGFLMTMGFALFVLDVVLQTRYGRVARSGPWRADTLEWSTTIPPLSYAFASLPHIESRRPLHDDPDLPAKLAAGRGYLGFVRHGWLETLGVDVATGRAEMIVRLPGPTYLPLLTALSTGMFFVGLLFKAYWVAAAGIAATLVLALLWTRGTGLREDPEDLPAGDGLVLPPHHVAASPPSWWGTVFILVADAALFVSLLFGCAYLAVVAPNWPPVEVNIPDGRLGIGGAAALALAAVAGRLSARSEPSVAWVLAGALAQLGILVLIMLHCLTVGDPVRHAYTAALWALGSYAAIHSALAALVALCCCSRILRGFVSARRNLDLRLNALSNAYTIGTAGVVLIAFHGLPHAVS